MTPSFMNSSPNSPFHIETHKDHDHHHQFFAPNQQVSSSSSYSYQFYYSSAQDQIGYYPPQPLEGENGGGSFEVETGLKLTLGNKVSEAGNGNPMKWMTSKMKKSSSIQSKKLPSSSSLDIDYSSNSSSNNIITSIRVCSDCNTTKTPLWRSGPKGPKSLCNACGIRQRKARRAMAAAADGTTFACETPKVKIKVNNNKEKIKKNIIAQSTVPFKKRCCKGINIINNSGIEKTTTTITTTSISSQEPKTKKLGFEDFLINLSNKLAFHHVFPQDDKEAAILLMALSCDLIHS